MHRWGYAPRLDALAAQLLGGEVSPLVLKGALQASGLVVMEDGFVCLPGHEPLLQRSRRRIGANGRLDLDVRSIAEAYARDLVRVCPFVECVALAGSVASGAWASGDDIDFDLFVARGTKYLCYLVANLVGLRYAWRYRHIESDELHRMPFLPKITCTNVVWPEEQTRPFVRQDSGLAFELMRCIPLYGAARFERVLADNPWLDAYLPQIRQRHRTGVDSIEPTAVWRALRFAGSRPALLRLLEFVSRGLSWVLYHAVQGIRRRNPAARARMEFLRRVKFPYEVFQD